MSQENADLIRTATEALNNGDMDTFLGHHSPDVKFHFTGRHAAAGDGQGRDGLAGTFQTFMGLLDEPPKFEIHDILASDDHVVVLGTQRATRGGKTNESDSYVTAHVKNGQFTEVWITPVDPYSDDEFLS